jgi:hypothetical protein
MTAPIGKRRPKSSRSFTRTPATLHDAAYNADRMIATGNHYKQLIFDLQKRAAPNTPGLAGPGRRRRRHRSSQTRHDRARCGQPDRSVRHDWLALGGRGQRLRSRPSGNRAPSGAPRPGFETGKRSQLAVEAGRSNNKRSRPAGRSPSRLGMLACYSRRY